MHGGHLVIELGFYKLHAWLKEFSPHNKRHSATNKQHGEREPEVHSTNVFMVGCKHPAHDALSGAMMPMISVIIVTSSRSCHNLAFYFFASIII